MFNDKEAMLIGLQGPPGPPGPSGAGAVTVQQGAGTKVTEETTSGGARTYTVEVAPETMTAIEGAASKAEEALQEAVIAVDIAQDCYIKPETGIPEAHLSASVQEKLNSGGGGGGGASIDVEEATDGDVEVVATTIGGVGTTYTLDLKDTAKTKLAKADTAYQKPSGGIPESDLTSDAQTKLNSAATALSKAEEALQEAVIAVDIAEDCYSKPSTGIPESDLSASVQAKLNSGGGGTVKVEAITGGDVRVDKTTEGSNVTYSLDLVSDAKTKLGKADTAYQKPSSGIPKSDMASSVQTSLGKADSSVQSISGDSTISVVNRGDGIYTLSVAGMGGSSSLYWHRVTFSNDYHSEEARFHFSFSFFNDEGESYSALYYWESLLEPYVEIEASGTVYYSGELYIIHSITVQSITNDGQTWENKVCINTRGTNGDTHQFYVQNGDYLTVTDNVKQLL